MRAALAFFLLLARAVDAREVGVHLAPKNPTQWEASQLLIQGTQLLKAKEPFKARPLMEKAEQLWPEEAHVHFNLGACYQEMGDFPRAIAEYQQAMNINPDLIECLPDIATCYQLMGNYSDAITYFKQYLKRDPKAEDVQQINGMILALSKQASKQVNGDPQSEDYLASVLKNGRLQRWQLQRLPLKVFISNGADEQGKSVPDFRPYYNDMLLDTLNSWVKASDYRLAYVLVDNAANADLVCTWTDQVGFLRDKGTSVEQGAARVRSRPAANRNEEEIIQVRMIILLVNPNSRTPISDQDVKKTCLHELGHALGFSGHSNNNKDVMFYSESPSIWAALTKRDRNTMARLYGDYPPYAWPNNGMR